MGHDTTLANYDITEKFVQSRNRRLAPRHIRGKIWPTLRRYEWQAASGEEQYAVSCYHELRFPPTRGSRRQGTQVRQQGRLHCARKRRSEQRFRFTYQVHQRRRVERSYPSSKGGGHGQQGTGDRPLRNATAASCLQRMRFFPTLTFQ